MFWAHNVSLEHSNLDLCKTFAIQLSVLFQRGSASSFQDFHKDSSSLFWYILQFQLKKFTTLPVVYKPALWQLT